MRCRVEQTKVSEGRLGDNSAFPGSSQPFSGWAPSSHRPQVGGHREVIQEPSRESINLQEHKCVVLEIPCSFKICQTMESS